MVKGSVQYVTITHIIRSNKILVYGAYNCHSHRLLRHECSPSPHMHCRDTWHSARPTSCHAWTHLIFRSLSLGCPPVNPVARVALARFHEPKCRYYADYLKFNVAGFHVIGKLVTSTAVLSLLSEISTHIHNHGQVQERTQFQQYNVSTTMAAGACTSVLPHALALSLPLALMDVRSPALGLQAVYSSCLAWW